MPLAPIYPHPRRCCGSCWPSPQRRSVTLTATTLLDCCVLAEERRTSSRHDWLLLGEQIAKDIFHPLSELEVLVRIQDHGLHEGLGLLTTRFPNGFDGQAPFPR